MRNLKRALSLALASVMLLGMMVVGTSAASYPDVDENDNVEAIEVLNAVNVMIGRQGNFEPDEAVNRHEMAVIMAKLVLGVDTADNYVGTHPFTDVVPWADKYVAACYENGLVYGTSTTTFGGSNPLTAVQAAAMMLRALGYKDLEKTADDWRAPITAMANQIRLFNGVASNPSQRLNRNQVAQLALNTLKSPMVNLKDNTISWTDGEGQVIMTGGDREYIALSSHEAYAKAINDTERAGTSASGIQGYTVELGEHLYNGKLKLDNNEWDDFGRPARYWEYDGKAIGTYIKEELMVYENVGEVTGKALYDVLGAKTIDDYGLTVNLDGVSKAEIVRAIAGYDGDASDINNKHNVDYVFDSADLNRNNKATIGATGTGVLTQVFVDHETRDIYVAVINTYLALADKDYDAKKEELSVRVYDLAEHAASGEYVKDILNKQSAKTIKLAAEDFPVVEDADKDTAFLLTVAQGEVQSVVPAEVLSGVQISSFKKNSNVVVDGTTYKFDTTVRFDAEALKEYTDLNNNGFINLKDRTYNVYLDVYGNLIGVEEVDAVNNYVFIAAIDLNDSNLVNGTADARAIFLDGTSDTIRVNMGKSTISTWPSGTPDGGIHKNSILNTWCTYTVNNSGVYNLSQVSVVDAADKGTPAKNGLAQYHESSADSEVTIDKKHITLKGKNGVTGEFARVYGDEKTVYLTAELDELINEGGTWGVISGVDTVSTSIESTNLTVWKNETARAKADNDDTKAEPGDDTKGNRTLDWSKGVYTLYNDDGVIIAAVVVGEDNGASKNLVYVHSGSVDYEAYNGSSSRAAGDGLWTWTRKVISDGEEVTLTEVSDGNSYLARMKQYNWYQIKTNAKGEVIEARKLPGVADGSGLSNATLERLKDLALDYLPDYVKAEKGKDLGEIAYTVQNGSGTVLYHNEEFIDSYLSMSGRTLYVATNDETGFIVNKNVNYVLQQWNSNKKDTFIETGSGSDNLASVIDELNDRYDIFDKDGKWTGKSYKYQISAILENGVASSVVIYDNNNNYVRPDGKPATGNATMDFDQDTGVWTLNVPVADSKVKDLTISQIRDYLLDAGCTSIVKNDGKKWSFVYDELTAKEVVLNIVGETAEKTYTITVDDKITNGTVTPSKTSAAKGTTVTLTVDANQGYKLEKITVTYADGTVKDITASKSFVMPDQNVTVSASFEPVGEPIKITYADDPRFELNNAKEHSYVVSITDTMTPLTEVTEGMTITLDPSLALSLKSDPNIEKNGDNYTIKKGAKIEVVMNKDCSFNGSQWMVKVGNTVMFIKSNIDKAAAQPRLSKARSVSVKPTWIDEAMEDKDHIYTITHKGFTWVGQVQEVGGYEGFGLSLTAPAGADFDQAFTALAEGFGANVFDNYVVTEKNPDTDDTYTLTLRGLLAPKAEVNTDKTVTVYTVAENGVPTLVPGTYKVETDGERRPYVEYKIPKDALVQIQDDNSGYHFDNGMLLGNDQHVGYLVTEENGDETYVRVKKLDDIALGTGGSPLGASLNFTMEHDVLLDLRKTDTLRNAEERYLVEADAGVEITMSRAADASYPADSITLRGGEKAYVYPTAYTLNITKVGKGTGVFPAVFMGNTTGKTGTVSGWTFSDHKDVHFYSGINITPGVSGSTKSETSIWPAWGGAGFNTTCFAALGTEIGFEFMASSAANRCGVGHVIVVPSDKSTQYVFDADSGFVVDDAKTGTWKVQGDKDVKLSTGVKFTLGEGVYADLATKDNNVKTYKVEPGTHYMTANASWVTTGVYKVLGDVSLNFEDVNDQVDSNVGVVEKAKIGQFDNDSDSKWHYSDKVTTAIVDSAQVFEGARWDAFTAVVAKDGAGLVDEAWLVETGGAAGDKVEIQVFDDLYDVKTLPSATSNTGKFTYSKTTDSKADTIYVDPEWKASLTVYGGVPKGAKGEDYTINVNGVPGKAALNDIFSNVEGEHVCIDVVVGNTRIELEVVKK